MSDEDDPTRQPGLDAGCISGVLSKKVVGLWATGAHKSRSRTRSVNKWVVRLKCPHRALEDLFLVPRNIFLSWSMRQILWRSDGCAVMFQHTICEITGTV